jgi:hypothetical protein
MAMSPSADPSSPVTTTSRAVALRFAPDSVVWGGTGLDLAIDSSASATQRLGAGAGAEANATALGLGVGVSRFLAAAADQAFFSSERLTLITGGGQIGGSAEARATAINTGITPAIESPQDAATGAAEAQAVNVAIGAVDLLSRNGAPLWIGSEADPFRAQAIAAGSGALLATARVRGLEGTPAADISPIPTFSGQPNAVVEAVARLASPAGAIPGAALGALADATGLEGYRVQALANWDGQQWTAQVGGSATARLQLPSAMGPPAGEGAGAPALLASAIGIDSSTILGPVRGGLTVLGEGLTSLEGLGGSSAALTGLGIHNSEVFAHGGNNQVVGLGGLSRDGAALAGAAGPLDAAGIDASTVLLGGGQDLVVGRSLLPGSFDGIRESIVNTGSGDDTALGTSHASSLAMGGGQDRIRLDRARDSFLEGGAGNDSIVVGAGSLANRLSGGFGNDALQSVGGSGNRLDGGFGQDLLEALGGGGEIFVQSNAGAALRAADSRSFAEQLCLPSFWTSLSAAEKESIWSTGRWQPTGAQGGGTGLAGGAVDVMTGFDPGRGDRLEISSSLAGMTQAMWDSLGTIVSLTPGPSLPLVGVGAVEAGSTSSLAVPAALVQGTLEEILRLGVGAPTIAYATDTHQLMFDGDGDWSRGAISIGSISLASGVAGLEKAAIGFNA